MKNVKTAYHYNLRGNKYMQEHKEPAHDKLDRTDNHRPRPAPQGRDMARNSSPLGFDSDDKYMI